MVSAIHRLALVTLAAVVLATMPCLGNVAQAQSVVSVNLCADQLVLELGDVKQVLGLSPLARDPALSFHAPLAIGFPMLKGSAEELVTLAPDIVLLGRFDSAYTRAILAQRGRPFLLVDTWTTFDALKLGVRTVAESLGQIARGDELMGDVSRSLARLEGLRAKLDHQVSALILLRRGFVMHAGLTVEILERAGFRNAAAEVGVGNGGFASLEKIVHARPDFLVIAAELAGPEDQGEAYLLHPALERLYPASRRIVAPERLATCAGPSTPALIEALRLEIEAKVLHR